MQRWITMMLIVGVLALTWYGAVGETGPIGWLNGMQATNTGHYSRVLSLFILFIGIGIATVGLLMLWIMARDRFLAGPPAPRRGFEDVPLFAPRPAGARPPSFWRTSLIVLLVLMALSWGGTLGWHAWDWHRRASDAGSDYPVLRLSRDQVPERPADGGHLRLQGRLLWEQALVRHEGQTHESSDEVFLPVGGADWQPGDAVHFVIRLSPSGVFPLQHREDGADAPLWIRVDGAVPGATLPMFSQGRSPVSDAAVMVRLVTPQGGPPADTHPVFDRASALQIGGGSSGFLAFLWLTAVVTLKTKAWMQRRASRGAVPASRA
jgi:hypothetical protein